jgi:hypothetical protein
VITEVPAEMPVTMPVLEPTSAIEVALELHVPPPASVSVVVAPSHTLAVPLIVDGSEFTNTEVVTKQPVAAV